MAGLVRHFNFSFLKGKGCQVGKTRQQHSKFKESGESIPGKAELR